MEDFKFKTTIGTVYLSGVELGICFSTPSLRLGDRVAPAGNLTAVMLVNSAPIATPDGWRYKNVILRNDIDKRNYIFEENTEFIRIGQSPYSDGMDWGTVVPVPPKEVLTPYQAVELAIETLGNFVDEYSDVQPIIDRLKDSLKTA